MIWKARQNGQLSLEAELMIEEITEQTARKNCRKKQKLARKERLLASEKEKSADSGDL